MEVVLGRNGNRRRGNGGASGMTVLQVRPESSGERLRSFGAKWVVIAASSRRCPPL
jgi:hypothetical protein